MKHPPAQRTMEHIADRGGLRTYLRPYWDGSNTVESEIAWLNDHPLLKVLLKILIFAGFIGAIVATIYTLLVMS